MYGLAETIIVRITPAANTCTVIIMQFLDGPTAPSPPRLLHEQQGFRSRHFKDHVGIRCEYRGVIARCHNVGRNGTFPI